MDGRSRVYQYRRPLAPYPPASRAGTQGPTSRRRVRVPLEKELWRRRWSGAAGAGSGAAGVAGSGGGGGGHSGGGGDGHGDGHGGGGGPGFRATEVSRSDPSERVFDGVLLLLFVASVVQNP